jgi:hypothetical protein
MITVTNLHRHNTEIRKIGIDQDSSLYPEPGKRGREEETWVQARRMA